MPKLFRKQYCIPIPEGAERVEDKGRLCVRFRRKRGPWAVAPITASGDKCLMESSRWYASIRDPRTGKVSQKPLSANKQVAQIMLAKLLERAELAKVGIVDPFAEHNVRTVYEHLDDFKSHKVSMGGNTLHVKATISQVNTILRDLQITFLNEINSNSVVQWLVHKQKKDQQPIIIPPHPEDYSLIDAAKLLGISATGFRSQVKSRGISTKRNQRYSRGLLEDIANKIRGVGPTTRNHYLVAIKSFTRWLFLEKRIPLDPLVQLKRTNTSTDVRRARRDLSVEEIGRLLEVTRQSPTEIGGLSGHQRYFLYLLALTTGFRFQALLSLTPSAFELDSDPPLVVLSASANKSKKRKIQPLPTSVVPALRDFLKCASPTALLFPSKRAKGWQMLRMDLCAADIPYTIEGPDGHLFADFHSLRHTYLTLASKSGIDLRTVQELAGHSSPNITAKYAHRGLYDLFGELEEKFPKLVSVPLKTETPQAS